MREKHDQAVTRFMEMKIQLVIFPNEFDVFDVSVRLKLSLRAPTIVPYCLTKSCFSFLSFVRLILNRDLDPIVVPLRHHSASLGNKYFHRVTCREVQLEEEVHEQDTM